ncbi:unnamed protein product [marine sediment metagenome]|uniref:Uncharacterized protein n=1 Tax=marine sediment metagenome TaxID=412755 RepID=X0UAL7_9ZZZZ
MKIEQAKKEAREVARNDNVRMVVTFNPYDEETFHDRDGGYGYHPAATHHIFESNETIVEQIPAGGGR